MQTSGKHSHTAATPTADTCSNRDTDKHCHRHLVAESENTREADLMAASRPTAGQGSSLMAGAVSPLQVATAATPTAECIPRDIEGKHTLMAGIRAGKLPNGMSGM